MDSNRLNIAYALQLERDSRTSSTLYDWSQVQFSYNSNHMEGSTITEAQTDQIYHENAFLAEKDQIIRKDDQIETENHFKLFNYMLNTVDEPLTLDYIAKLQGILKKGTSDEDNPLKVVGGFKKIDNIIRNDRVGDTETSTADNVKQDLQRLIDTWESSKHLKMEDYAKFHYQFETIHPFSDGNGRVGRILLFKERCRNRLMPFIIRDENRLFYIRGLNEYKRQPGYLIGTFGQSMDEYTSAVQQVYGPNFERLPKPKRQAKGQELPDNFLNHGFGKSH
ncbi:Fic family protein [Limosilactobacillus fastidiosus]|uniref:Fic family protein n=1 Tax=Limosilactobacillus fastidiosus TaxID=2759855 RepID=A0A7W3TY45_9LACO|nr:Fic family protein [Limosilactobacillus fastidiosus]MBB1063155.1 Fic family protein [Limosilactobacillus fastidiosus]MBB1085429.1 Fic family protein [Limosilactobacillus fastidiosus]MCD7083730.1 Fic family protein [Limosilactobacillus fastidiosus]MCD7085411.1 Fic family protein [Limosilactobacillus fastidiosus]MCD7114824.1 Fic family protein [Limosilactobacillus fastidiosus]